MGESRRIPDDLRWCIGPPLYRSFMTLLETEDVAVAQRAVELYRERFGPVGLYENSVYPGVPEMLDALRRRGLRLYVATAKPTVYAARVVEHFGLDRHFERLYGSELDGTRTDKVELVGHLIAETGIDPGAAALVGDREHDILAARAHGMLPVGVTYGYGSVEELDAAGVRILCRSPRDVAELLAIPSG
jgi:phosphoglycolate phosphatase